MDNSELIIKLAEELGRQLQQRQRKIASAESCTGGWAAQAITAVAGSSHWYERGFITYTNIAKQEMLGVPEPLIEQHGAVSEEVAVAMAEGALAHSHAEYALAITGIAGPGGGSEQKPVGTVCFAWAGKQQASIEETQHYQGDRAAVRAHAVQNALQGMIRFFQSASLGGMISRPGPVVK